ncbi:hypothetical protein LA52FAK_07360 [Desulforhopalus sp. 52FAK]
MLVIERLIRELMFNIIYLQEFYSGGRLLLPVRTSVHELFCGDYGGRSVGGAAVKKYGMFTVTGLIVAV